MPQRAVVGAHWSGHEHCWRHAPRDYAAIHFHDGDLEECGWTSDFTWTVPDDLPSGAYALHLTCDAGEDYLPLYVLANRAGPFAPIAFLASTFTYQAYADHARGNADAAYQARVAAWGAYPYNPDDFPIYGRSTYNKHADGAGIAFSSRRRPILTMRPGFLTFDDPRGSGLRHYPADTHLLAWLTAKGIAFDIITDEDLDDEGVALLASYRAVLTGSHPEYHTLGTLDALQAYTGSGGRLACLGGNGFYWRIARSPDLPHVIELRRAEGGIRAWAAEPGEYYHQLDGGLGGLWRRNRRPPQMLTGVGFCGQGTFESTYFRRTPASHDPAFAWMFEGIEDDIIGDYGLSGGGAAGFELDRSDRTLGTPENAVVLARAENLPAIVRHGARGAAFAPEHADRRAAGGSAPRRDRLFRHAVGRSGVRRRIDHLLRQSLARRRIRPAQCRGCWKTSSGASRPELLKEFRAMSKASRSRLVAEVDFEKDGVQNGFLRLFHSMHASAYGFIPIPIVVIRNGAGPTALFSAGNHGDEYRARSRLCKLAQWLKPEMIAGRVILLSDGELSRRDGRAAGLAHRRA